MVDVVRGAYGFFLEDLRGWEEEVRGDKGVAKCLQEVEQVESSPLVDHHVPSEFTELMVDPKGGMPTENWSGLYNSYKWKQVPKI